MKKRRNPAKNLNIYWVLDQADIPSGLKFIPDEEDSEHYFLTVTEVMLLSALVSKLKRVARRMSVIRNGSKVL